MSRTSLVHLLATPPPAFLFHSQCQTSSHCDRLLGPPLFRFQTLRSGSVRERRRCMPLPTCRQPPFFVFFSGPSGPMKSTEQSAYEPFNWPAKQRLQSAGRFRICPAVFSGKSVFCPKAKNLSFQTTLHNEPTPLRPEGRGAPNPRRENMHLRNIPARPSRSWPFRREAGLYGGQPGESSPIAQADLRQVGHCRLKPGFRAEYTNGSPRLPQSPPPAGEPPGLRSRQRRAGHCRPRRADVGFAGRSSGPAPARSYRTGAL